MNEQFEKSWKIYNTIINWIKFSDTKAAVVIATNGVFFGLIFKNMINVLYFTSTPSWFFVLLIFMGIETGIISIIFALYCLVPNTNSGDKFSIFFFAHIAKFKIFEDYQKKFDATISNDQEFNKQIAEQIWVISKIALNKYEKVKGSILFLGLTIILLVIPMVLLGN